MKRSKFLKVMLGGSVALCVSPMLLPNKPTIWEKIMADNPRQFDVGLFYGGIELKYKGYHRMPITINYVLKGDSVLLKHPDIIFPRVNGEVHFDSIIFFKNNDPQIYWTSEGWCYDGLITICAQK